MPPKTILDKEITAITDIAKHILKVFIEINKHINYRSTDGEKQAVVFQSDLFKSWASNVNLVPDANSNRKPTLDIRRSSSAVVKKTRNLLESLDGVITSAYLAVQLREIAVQERKPFTLDIEGALWLVADHVRPLLRHESELEPKKK